MPPSHTEIRSALVDGYHQKGNRPWASLSLSDIIACAWETIAIETKLIPAERVTPSTGRPDSVTLPVCRVASRVSDLAATVLLDPVTVASNGVWVIQTDFGNSA